MTHELNDLALALVKAATSAYQRAQAEYREQMPESHAAICTLVEHGAQLHASVTLTPTPKVELGVLHAGRFEPIFTWPAAPERLN